MEGHSDVGERAFEIVLARKMRDEGLETQWFARHGSTPITELPAHWSDEYRAIVERRIAVIEGNRNIGLIERPECKRRWASKGWDAMQAKALRDWLLDRCEARELWYHRQSHHRPLAPGPFSWEGGPGTPEREESRSRGRQDDVAAPLRVPDQEGPPHAGERAAVHAQQAVDVPLRKLPTHQHVQLGGHDLGQLVSAALWGLLRTAGGTPGQPGSTPEADETRRAT